MATVLSMPWYQFHNLLLAGNPDTYGSATADHMTEVYSQVDEMRKYREELGLRTSPGE